MKKTWIGMILCIALGGSVATAITITVTGANNAQSDSGVAQSASDVGTLSLTSAIVTNVSDSGTLSYAVSNLDLNGVGVSNDSVLVNFRLASGRGLITTNSALGAPSAYLSNTNRISAPQEGLTWTFDSLSVNLDGGTDNGSGSFLGFTGATLMFPIIRDRDNVAKVNGREIAATGGVFQFIALSDVSSIDVGWVAGDGVRVASVDYKVDIPEPAMASALIGVFAAALLCRRRGRLSAYRPDF